jgi:hypothetical protein
MKKLILAALIAVTPLLAQAVDVNISGLRVQAPGVTVTFGSRDSRGYYWDGDGYRDPDYGVTDWKSSGLWSLSDTDGWRSRRGRDHAIAVPGRPQQGKRSGHRRRWA